MAISTVEKRKNPFRKTTLPSLWILNEYVGTNLRRHIKRLGLWLYWL